MFARWVTMKLKPHSAREFTRTLEKDIIPLLRKQTGFKEEFSFEAYGSGQYSEVVKLLETVVEGTPDVQSGEVSNSTIQRIPATPAAR